MNRIINRLILFVIILVVSSDVAMAQRDNVWCFGYYAMLDFNNGSPVSTVYTAATGLQHCNPAAAVCDEEGKLLFYSDGDTVMTRQHEPMPNGKRLITDPLILNHKYLNNPSYGLANDCVIVPVPGSNTRYYIFYTTHYDLQPYQGRLYYSIVDMALNNGLGDVDVNYKGILLDSAGIIGKNLIATPGDRCNIWLLTVTPIAPGKRACLKAFEINRNGINPEPVITENFMAGEEILVSPDRKKLVSGASVTLYDFDACTGKVSNGVSIGGRAWDNGTPTAYSFVRVAFSPDNTKLYGTSRAGFSFMAQFDISSGDSATMAASRIMVGDGNTGGGGELELGPDGKIYVSRQAINSPALCGVIESPNLAGAACNFVRDFPFFGPGTRSNDWTLHKSIPVLLPQDTIVHTFKDSLALCSASEVVLQASDTNGMDYVWNDGTTGHARTVTEPGIYWVQYTNVCPCISFTDTFIISGLPFPKQNLGTDTLFCKGAPVNMVLAAISIPGASVLWSTGSTDSIIRVTDTGQYWVTVTYPPCSESDSVTIGAQHCTCWFGVPNAFTPNQDGWNDYFLPVIENDCPNIQNYTLSIFNRFGQRIYSANRPDVGWNGTFGGKPCEAGTYFYEFRFSGGTLNEQYYQKGDFTLLR